MADQPVPQHGRYTLQMGQSSTPTVLSNIQFPTQPSSSSSTSESSPKYRHVLTSKAISPQMDLVAIISQDVAAPSSSNAQDAASLLPPPPPGMSAVANQARMRMLMMARARALAAGGTKGAAVSTDTPKVTKCPSLRLSLWRMASTAGESGSKVWDFEIKVPDHFEDLGDSVKEKENVQVCAMSWSPDCRSIALTIEVVRTKRDDQNDSRKKRYLVLFAMQDGKQERLILVPSQSQSQQDPSQLFGLVWQELMASKKTTATFGSAEHILSLMDSLPELSNLLVEKEGKSQQRQRAMNALRGGPQIQGSSDLKIEEIALTKTDKWAVALLKYPRSTKKHKELMCRDLLCIHDENESHLYFDSTIYLGSIPSKDRILSIEFESERGDLLVSTRNHQSSSIILNTVPTCLHPSSTRFFSLLHLISLSTLSYNLYTYSYDALVDIRNLYRTTHINCITPWIKKGKSIERKFSTHFQSEMQMLLLTSFANETITSVLVGNETMTEGDLNKLRSEIASAWNKIEILLDAMLQAMQRVAIVYEEVQGCWLWQERYGDFLQERDGDTIKRNLSLIGQAQVQLFTLLRHAQQEARCWNHFYKWFKFERTRQEAVRDQVPEPKTDVTFDVLLIAEFINRGFYNIAFEQAIGVSFDRKTRGSYVEDEDEEVQEESIVEEQVKIDKSISAEQMNEEGKQRKDFMSLLKSRDNLKNLVDEKLKELQEPPKMEDLKRTSMVTRDDILKKRSSPFISTGSIAGIHSRQKSKNKNINLMDAIKDLLETSSNIFSSAVARFALQKDPTEFVDFNFGTMLVPLRSDSLLSKAPESTVKQSDATFLRTCKDSNIHYFLGVQETDEGDSIIMVAAIDTSSTRKSTMEIACRGKVIDVGFYSTEEVAALLYDGQKSRLVSFQLDFSSGNRSIQESIVPQRCYELQQDTNSPTQLALNQAKEVAATLDEEGRLVYYDLVILEQRYDVDEDMN